MSSGPGTQCESPLWVAGPQLLKPSPPSPRVCIGGKLELRLELELEPRYSSMKCGHLNYCAKCLSPPEDLGGFSVWVKGTSSLDKVWDVAQEGFKSLDLTIRYLGLKPCSD